MGSWDATCMVTNLPIRSGDLVVAFLLQEHGISVRMSNLRENWAPASLPIYGRYTDQGEIETDISPEVESFTREVCASWESRSSHYLGWDEPESVQEYLKFAERYPDHEHDASLSIPVEGVTHAGMCLILRGAYDILVQQAETSDELFDGFWSFRSLVSDHIYDGIRAKRGNRALDQLTREEIREDFPGILDILEESWAFESGLVQTRRVWGVDRYTGCQTSERTKDIHASLAEFSAKHMREWRPW